ncbi:24-hydroxycholesterol 7-alpha-hydroxylase-like [Anneissia japonica]|uniref:24-hydroxycholesterol 7-alpha-hydroxylase-like n=1 Tax=Anneissia japonica TaxID=1529436 RepID=UPI001425A3C4|nr:24-hydroxycholesterol 7-alpha-hydroxylase-like [Anneissia japonica]
MTLNENCFNFPVIIASILAIIFVRYVVLKKMNRRNCPPTISGWIPWMGVGVEFGKAPLTYIECARQKHGSVFTILAAGKYLTFLTDADDFHFFFNSKNVDFQQAVQEAVQNTGKLLQLFRRVMFGAVVNNLFGEGAIPTDEEHIQQLEDIFVKFDDQFEYGSQIPDFFLRDWAACKQWLLKVFKTVQDRLQLQSSKSVSLVQQLMDIVDAKSAPNFALLLLWASQANAIPISFWVLAFLHTYPEELSKVSKELNDAFGDKQTELVVDEEIISKLPSIKRCILETIRLRSPGVITRKVVKSFDVKGYTIPVGDMLMVSPYWAHRDQRFFTDPESFKPDRWLAADLEKNFFLDGFIGFGGGRYQCPGRWFALMEIHVLITLILQKLSLKALDPLPKPSTLHVVGTQQPQLTYRVQFSKR